RAGTLAPPAGTRARQPRGSRLRPRCRAPLATAAATPPVAAAAHTVAPTSAATTPDGRDRQRLTVKKDHVNGEWPVDLLAVAAPGWPRPPFLQVVLKLHSRCDLACDYCFVYAMGDSTWRERPHVIRPDVVDRTARRIADHCRAHQLGHFSVVLHGGEPLLAG